MLHTETVAPKTLELLTQLMDDATFNQFLLVGGTSLSLQLGHRISVDLDLFHDLAAMKLNAIVGNGTRMKDFIDIAYLSNKITFNEMLNAYESKYKSNPVMVLKAISYFDDINYDEPIQMLDKKDFEWKKIRKHLLLMVKSPDKIFGGL